MTFIERQFSDIYKVNLKMVMILQLKNVFVYVDFQYMLCSEQTSMKMVAYNIKTITLFSTFCIIF